LFLAILKADGLEVDEIVETGALDPETIVTPSIYVDRIVQAKGIRFV